MKQNELALLCKTVLETWMEVFKIIIGEDVTQMCEKINSLINSAYEHKNKAVILLKSRII